jgi:hypothetical protein
MEMRLSRDHCDQVGPTVLFPAVFVRVAAKWTFFAITYGVDPVALNSGMNKLALDLVGTTLAQGQVVLGGAQLITMAFNRNAQAGMLLHEFGIVLNGGNLIRADGEFVGIEKDILAATARG